MRMLSKLQPNQEATQAGLELNDKAHVGLPEPLAVMGSSDLGDGCLRRQERGPVGGSLSRRGPPSMAPSLAGALPTWISSRVRWEVWRQQPWGRSQVPWKVCRWK